MHTGCDDVQRRLKKLFEELASFPTEEFPGCSVHIPCAVSDVRTACRHPTITIMERCPKIRAYFYIFIHKKQTQSGTLSKEPEPVMPARHCSLPEDMTKRKKGGDAAVASLWENVQPIGCSHVKNTSIL